jgi:hypothetical protein
MKIYASSLLFLGIPATVSAATHVNIDVECKGLDLKKLSLNDDTDAGHILEDSYTTVHKKSGDDSELSDVTYRGIVGAGSHDNDVDRRKGHAQSIHYQGHYDCGALCPNDDDAAISFFVASGGIAVRAWEAEFARGLLESRRSTFRGVEQCNIMMRAAPIVEDGEKVNCGLRSCVDA